MSDEIEEPADEPWHGTLAGYTHHGCRGPECRDAWNAYHTPYMRRYRAGIRARGGAE